MAEEGLWSAGQVRELRRGSGWVRIDLGESGEAGGGEGHGGGIIGGDRSEADDEFDAFGDGHFEHGDRVFGDEDEEAGGGVGGSGDEDADDMFLGLGLDLLVLLTGDESDGVLARAGEFDEDNLSEGGSFIGGESGVDLFDGAVDFIEERNAKHDEVDQLDEFFADVMAGEPADDADDQDSEEESDEAPVPVDEAFAAVLVGPFPGKPQEPEEGIGNTRDGTEEPDDNGQ